MPTIRNMIQSFVESSCQYSAKKALDLLLGNEEYSLAIQEEMVKIIDRNIIKTTDKTILSQQIAEAISASFKEIRRFKDKVPSKEVYTQLVDYLNKKYNFRINIGFFDEEIIGTPEERCVYLLREAERRNLTGQRKNLAQIAEELGCHRRTLEMDVKRITEQGFKLLGQNIKLVDDREDVLKMESTPHPVILMQNISQLIVILEGLRSMEKIKAYKNFARSSAINIWNQLTEYAQNKILDALEMFDNSKDAIGWYLQLRDESNHHARFLTEFENCAGDISSQLMYLSKNKKLINIIYLDNDEKEVVLYDCKISGYHPLQAKATVTSLGKEYEIEDEKILDIEII